MLFLISLSSAVNIEVKDNFLQNENFIASVSANFIEPPNTNFIELLRGHVRVTSDFYLLENDGIYYIATTLLDKSPGNYSVILNEVSYRQGNTILDEDIVINFTISENKADFYVNPPVISTDQNFKIYVQNLANKLIELDISLNKVIPSDVEPYGFFASLFEKTSFEPETFVNFTIKTGNTIAINFNVRGKYNKDSLQEIIFKTENTEYKMPIFVFANDTSPKKTYLTNSSLFFEPFKVNQTVIIDSSKSFILQLFNNGEEIENFTLGVSSSLEKVLELSTYYLDDINKNSSLNFDVYVNTSQKPGLVEGFIYAKKDNITTFAEIPIYLYFISGMTNNSVDNPNANDLIDEEEESSSSSLWSVFGWILLLGIIGFGIWFYFKKYKNTSIKPNLLKN